jgi:hypothetical protein
MCNWETAGELAAEVLYEYLTQAKVTTPIIWILTGTPGMEDREKGFVRQLKQHAVKATIVPRPAKFLQDVAREAFRKLAYDSGVLPHAVFCTNDEMAIGVFDAVSEIKNGLGPIEEDTATLRRQVRGLKIVGFDGIHDLTTHLSDGLTGHGHPHFLNTINVQVREQVTKLLERVVAYVSDPARDKTQQDRLLTVAATRFIDAKRQRERVASEIFEWRQQDPVGLVEYQTRSASDDVFASS